MRQIDLHTHSTASDGTCTPAEIVALAARQGIQMEEEKLLALANTWEVRHGGFSGRTAQQFIHYLEGRDET